MTLNKLAFSLLGALALTAPAFAGTAPAASGKCSKCVAPQVAPEELLGFTLSAGYDTKNIFRGLELADDWVSSSLDYTTAIGDGLRLDLGADYGHAANDGFGGGSFERLELSAGITKDLGAAELGLGYRNYQNFGDGGLAFDDTNEVNLSLASKVGIFNVGVAANYDIDGEGWYFEAAVNTEIVINNSVSLVPGANIGYGVDYAYQASALTQLVSQAITGSKLQADGFTAVGLSLALPVKLSKTATLTPYVSYNLPVDALDDLGEEEQFFGGVSLSVKF
jgi:hypothetical protein